MVFEKVYLCNQAEGCVGMGVPCSVGGNIAEAKPPKNYRGCPPPPSTHKVGTYDHFKNM